MITKQISQNKQNSKKKLNNNSLTGIKWQCSLMIKNKNIWKLKENKLLNKVVIALVRLILILLEDLTECIPLKQEEILINLQQL